MSFELKALLKKMVFYDIIIGLLSSFVISIFFETKIMVIFLIGLAIAIINFIVSGILLEKSLNSSKKLGKVLLPITYIVRIGIIILVTIPFLHELKSLLAYLGGFIMHFPILILSWFKSQKGSE